MIATAGLSLLLGTWASIYLLDVFFKTNHLTARRYNAFLDRTNISVSVAQIRWFTTSLNRSFVRTGHWRPKLLKIWFTFGVIFSLFAMILAILLLTLLLVNTVLQKPVEQQVLTPVMPGVNLPMSQMGYFLLTLLICGILHEFGHAVAAVREQVQVNGFGVFFMIMYPGAFVDLSTEHLKSVSDIQKLRIYCAGVWHNFIIVIFALLILFTLPWALTPFYSSGNGIVITHVVENSPVSGPRGLLAGEDIQLIGDCQIKTQSDLYNCIQKSMDEPSKGFCMPIDTIKQYDISQTVFTTVAGNIECCSNISNTHICFKYNSKAKASPQYACLPARAATDNRPICSVQSDCFHLKKGYTCVYPSLDNSTRLLRVSHGKKTPLLFLGHPIDLAYSVTVSNYVPRFTFVPLNLPYILDTFCQYLISLSGALAILNVVPCYALDGQWILHAFIEMSLGKIITNSYVRQNIFCKLLWAGTILVATNVCVAMWSLFNSVWRS